MRSISKGFNNIKKVKRYMKKEKEVTKSENIGFDPDKELKKFVIKHCGTAKYKILLDIGWFDVIKLPLNELYKANKTNISTKTFAEIAKHIFLNFDEVFQTIAINEEMLRKKAIYKTDFSYSLSNALGVGKNKSLQLVDSLLETGDFIFVPSENKRNKIIKPKKLTESEQKLFDSNLKKTQYRLFGGSKPTGDDIITHDDEIDQILAEIDSIHI